MPGVLCFPTTTKLVPVSWPSCAAFHLAAMPSVPGRHGRKNIVTSARGVELRGLDFLVEHDIAARGDPVPVNAAIGVRAGNKAQGKYFFGTSVQPQKCDSIVRSPGLIGSRFRSGQLLVNENCFSRWGPLADRLAPATLPLMGLCTVTAFP